MKGDVRVHEKHKSTLWKMEGGQSGGLSEKKIHFL